VPVLFGRSTGIVWPEYQRQCYLAGVPALFGRSPVLFGRKYRHKVHSSLFILNEFFIDDLAFFIDVDE